MSSSADTRHRLPLAPHATQPGHPAGGASMGGAASPGPLPDLAPPTAGADDADGEPLQVGDLARLTGKTVRAIHLYEELGLLRPNTRSKGRYRLYQADALVRVRWIGKLQDLGLSLSAIQQIVREWETSPSAPGAMSKMREVYAEKLEATREQIRRLQQLEGELAASLRYLETCDVCEPARLLPACTCCDRHDHADRAPELVAGFHVA